MTSYQAIQPLFQQLWNPTTEARIDGSVLLLAELQGFGTPATVTETNEDSDDSDSEASSEIVLKAQNGSSDESEPTSAEEDEDGDGEDKPAQPSNGLADGVQPALKPDDLEAGPSDIATTVMRRLIRGLASPREQARLGFSVALTEVRGWAGLV